MIKDEETAVAGMVGLVVTCKGDSELPSETERAVSSSSEMVMALSLSSSTLTLGLSSPEYAASYTKTARGSTVKTGLAFKLGSGERGSAVGYPGVPLLFSESEQMICGWG